MKNDLDLNNSPIKTSPPSRGGVGGEASIPPSRGGVGGEASIPPPSGELEGVAHEAPILVTGAAGFIGSNLVRQLFARYPGVHIVGLDNLNDYYDPALKRRRLAQIEALHADWTFVRADIADRDALDDLFARHRFTIVVNLAAQAGVRYSIDHPDAYITSNIVGFYNILEACRRHPVAHLVYASSSSVYGANSKVPYSTDDATDTPVSLYAATKKSNELLAHAYSRLYDIPATGLRFFTVYGPAGRPDMAYYKFTEMLLAGKTIPLYNYGRCQRDFTYIDDVVEAVIRVMRHAPRRRPGDDGLPVPPCRVYNVGNSSPVELLRFVTILQEELVRARLLPPDYDFAAHRSLVPMQPGDVVATFADTTPLRRDFGFRPSTPLRDGLRAFAEWYAREGKRGR